MKWTTTVHNSKFVSQMLSTFFNVFLVADFKNSIIFFCN